jgi:hypothetical protein
MAALVLGTAGAIVGGLYGGPQGAMIGWSIGSAIGGALDPQKTKQQGPRLNDLKLPGVQYGDTIPYIKGRYRTAGQVWWASDAREIATTTSEETGGKGGGPTVENTTYTYERDLLIGLTEHEIAGVPRAWVNGKLVYINLSSEAQAELLGVTEDASFIERALANLAASQNTPYWRRITVYTGTSTQLPDPTYEAAVGSANAVAYRHRAYVFIEGLQLGGAPAQMPNIEFEVCTKAEASDIDSSVLIQCDGTELADQSTYNSTVSTVGTPSIVGGKIALQTAGDVVKFTGTHLAGRDDQAMTIECQATIISTGAGTTYALMQYRYGPGGGTRRVRLEWQDSNKFLLYDTEDLGSQGTSSPTEIPYNERIHFAIVIPSGLTPTIRIYMNGTLMFTSPSGHLDATEYELWLGPLATGGGDVRYDNIRVKLGEAYTGSTITPEDPLSDPFAASGILTPEDEDLDDVVSALCVRSGLTTSQIDVTDLSTVTRQVRGIGVSQITSTRNVLEMLMTAYFFEAVVSDKIYFRVRASDASVDIPYEDLGASTGESVEPLALKLNSDIEIPAQFALTYANLNSDYNTDTQFSDRLITAVDESLETVQLPMVFIPSEAKLVVDAIMGDRAASITETEIALLGEYTAYEPTDVITTYDEDGTQYRLRLVQKTDTYPLLKFRAVIDDATVIESEAITSDDYTPVIDVDEPSDTVMELMDIPIGRDADDDTGFYVAAKGETSPWPGASIMKSSDDLSYSSVATVTESAVIGTVTVTLDDWDGGRVFDEFSSVTVAIGNGTLSSSTRSAVLGNKLTNCMLIGDEIIQFVTATLVSTGVYKLTRLLRGCRGTEWAMTGHADSERCFLLRTTGLRRVAMQNAELGLNRYYAGVTFGRTLSSALTGSPASGESFTNNANGKKPLSPVGLRVFRDSSNNITGTFHRRTRLSCRFAGSLGINVPLGETTESYEIDVLPVGSPNAVLRTIEVSDETFSYSAANQTSDGATPGDQFVFNVYQISATVDRGYALEKTA